MVHQPKSDHLHDLSLGKVTCWLGIHLLAASHGAAHSVVVGDSWGLVLYEAQAKRATTVLVAGELRDGGLGVLDGVELDNSSATGTSVWFVLNLGLLNLADGGEELNEILVACGPWKL